MTTEANPNIEHGVCRYCGEAIESRFRGRWNSDEHGSDCYEAGHKAPLHSGAQINRLHVPVR